MKDEGNRVRTVRIHPSAFILRMRMDQLTETITLSQAKAIIRSMAHRQSLLLLSPPGVGCGTRATGGAVGGGVGEGEGQGEEPLTSSVRRSKRFHVVFRVSANGILGAVVLHEDGVAMPAANAERPVDFKDLRLHAAAVAETNAVTGIVAR